MIPFTNRYWIQHARVPAALLGDRAEIIDDTSHDLTYEGLCRLDVEIADGRIARLVVSGTHDIGKETENGIPVLDWQNQLLWCCFADMHTHLDKGHIWQRTPNPDGTFQGAMEAVKRDAQLWHEEDVYRRMSFDLRCCYAHGTRAIRTHIDCFGEQSRISLGVFQRLQNEWADRLILQAASLVSLDFYLTPEGEALADAIAQVGGILGGVAYMNPDIDAQIDRTFQLAKERGLALDFHTDENGNPDSITLRKVAEAALRHDFPGKIVCGHCCSLAVQAPEQMEKTLALVNQAGIGIVSLPMCNLYLQDRQGDRTPRWRGIAPLHEIRAAGIPVAVASDNCRDPFYAFGDRDMLEVFTQSVRIAHLDMPYGDWVRTVTTNPADMMGLSGVGHLAVGLPADLILFKARDFSELLSRPQSDRIVLHHGKPIDTTLPNYTELDELMQV